MSCIVCQFRPTTDAHGCARCQKQTANLQHCKECRSGFCRQCSEEVHAKGKFIRHCINEGESASLCRECEERIRSVKAEPCSVLMMEAALESARQMQSQTQQKISEINRELYMEYERIINSIKERYEQNKEEVRSIFGRQEILNFIKINQEVIRNIQLNQSRIDQKIITMVEKKIMGEKQKLDRFTLDKCVVNGIKNMEIIVKEYKIVRKKIKSQQCQRRNEGKSMKGVHFYPNEKQSNNVYYSNYSKHNNKTNSAKESLNCSISKDYLGGLSFTKVGNGHCSKDKTIAQSSRLFDTFNVNKCDSNRTIDNNYQMKRKIIKGKEQVNINHKDKQNCSRYKNHLKEEKNNNSSVEKYHFIQSNCNTIENQKQSIIQEFKKSSNITEKKNNKMITQISLETKDKKQNLVSLKNFQKNIGGEEINLFTLMKENNTFLSQKQLVKKNEQLDKKYQILKQNQKKEIIKKGSWKQIDTLKKNIKQFNGMYSLHTKKRVKQKCSN